jgi:phospholipid/cholesterol/gamma-HCH transport system ATP-binding protein
MTGPHKITLKGVSKAFGDKRVLAGMDLDVPAGQSTVIIGGSGSGKSVTLKCILGLIRPDAGSIEINGEDVTRLSRRQREEVNRRIGMLFQSAALFDSLSVVDNVAFGLVQGKKLARREAQAIALDKLGQVGLGQEVADLSPDELSGGMRKRVGLARAIATDPEIIFFDEPTTGLDPIMGAVIDELIVKTVKEMGATALSITHDMASVRRIGDRVAMLHDGKIIWNGAVGEIDQSGNDHVDQFIHGRAEGPIKMGVRA